MVPDLENKLQPPFPTAPYLETGGSNGSLFRNCLQPPVPTVQCLESSGYNGSIFRNWIATPLSNCSIFINGLQPYLETFRKATPRSNGSMFRKWWFKWFPI